MTILKKFFKKSIIKKVLLIILVCILASVCFSAGKKYGVKSLMKTRGEQIASKECLPPKVKEALEGYIVTRDNITKDLNKAKEERINAQKHLELAIIAGDHSLEQRWRERLTEVENLINDQESIINECDQKILYIYKQKEWKKCEPQKYNK